MAMSNAEKQRRWRAAHADRRRDVQRIATMLTRRSHAVGRTIEAKVGWNGVTFDAYFYTLAVLLTNVLKTDRAINQLRWGLASVLNDRRSTRREAAWSARCGRERAQEQAIAWALDG